MVKKLYLAIGVLLAIIWSVVADSEDCWVAREHITLGDYFSLTKEELEAPDSDSHMLTVGLMSNCSGEPELEIIMLGEFGELGETTVMLPSEAKILTLQGEDQELKLQAFFYFINQKLLETSAGWKMTSWNREDWVMWPSGAGTKIEPVARAIIAGEWMFSRNTSFASSFFNIDDFGWPNNDLFIQFENYSSTYPAASQANLADYLGGGNHLMRSLLFIQVPGSNDLFITSSFRMPGQSESFWPNRFFDFVYQGIYYLIIDWQHLLQRKPEDFKRVFEWMQARLKLTESRADIVWRVALSSDSMLCNDGRQNSSCASNIYYLKPFDDLFTKFRIDVLVSSQVPEYARFRPTYNFVMLNDTSQMIPSIKDGTHRPYLQLILGDVSRTTQVEDFTTPLVQTTDVSSQCFLQVNFTASEVTGASIKIEADSQPIDSWSKYRLYMAIRRLSTIVLLISLAIAIAAILAPYAYDLVVFWCKEKETNNRAAEYPLVSITPDRHDNYKSIELDTLKSQSPPKELRIDQNSLLRPNWSPKLTPAD